MTKNRAGDAVQKKKAKRWTLSFRVSLGVIFMASLLLWAVMGVINIREYADYYFTECHEHLNLVLLNWMPLFLVTLLIYFLSRRATLSVLLSYALFIFMALVNYVKSVLRQDPFIPSDIKLLREALNIVGNFGASKILPFLLVIACAVGLGIFAVKKWNPTPLRIWWRIGGCALCLLAFWGLFARYYSNDDLYGSFAYSYGGKDSEYACKGFIYSFIHDLSSMKVEVPPNYAAGDYAGTEEMESASGYEDLEKPHVIMIMSEAFSDISESGDFDFTGYDDPLAHYRKIAEESLISDHIVTDVSGGGTAYTEFAALTGISPTILSTEISPYSYVRSNMDSLAWRFASLGYDTLAVHPGYSWFYNRINVYKYFGFDDFLYLEKDFDPDTQNKGGFISEEATFDALIESFANHLEESDAPLFEFCVTIQNHGGYAGKYGDIGQNFSSGVDFSEEDINLLSNYFEGLKDADEQLYRLIQYLESIDEPVVVVYFGDHLPSLSTVYETMGWRRSLDDPEAMFQYYMTPYLIWQNSAAAETCGIEEAFSRSTLSESGQISAFYLGAALMELLDFDGSPFLNYVNAMRAQLPAMSWYTCRDSSGMAVTEIPPDAQDMVSEYKSWSYYKLFDQDY